MLFSLDVKKKQLSINRLRHLCKQHKIGFLDSSIWGCWGGREFSNV